MNQNRLPKRVLYVENGIGYGGAAICMRHLVRNLDRSRYIPYVVTGRTGPEYEEISSEAVWKHIPDRRIDIVGAKERFAKSQWPDAVPGLRPLSNQILARLDDTFNFLPFFLQLLWFAWRNKVDLIHANNEPLCNRAALLVARTLRIPAICHVRGSQSGSKMMNWAFRLPTHFIPVSHWVSESIGRLDIKIARRTVIYDGIELDRLDVDAAGTAFRNRFEVPPEAFAVGLVGLLIPWKGQDMFLDAARILSEQISDLKMLVVGGTPEECLPYEHHLRQRVVDEGLQQCVVFTGHVSNMPEVYNGLDIVLSASTEPEPLGTVVIESMAMGRPLVAPAHGGAAEMADHEVNALLFEPGDAQALADSILRFYNQSELRERYARAAREHALATFDVNLHAERVQSVYDSALQTIACSTATNSKAPSPS